MTSRSGNRPGIPRPTMGQRSARSYYEEYNQIYGSQARRTDEFEDCDENDISPFSIWKNVAIGVIMVACIASFYPKVLHPLLVWVTGYGEQMNKATVDAETFHQASSRGISIGAAHKMRPGFGDSNMPMGSDRFASSNSKMAGHHPAKVQYDSSETSRSGSWPWVLPLYTIGIVIFLLYTLGKVLWKRPKISARHRYNLRYNSEKDRFEANYPGIELDDEEESQDSDNSMFHDEDEMQRLHENLHDHNLNMEGDTDRLQNMQVRLEETESAMRYLLTQLETLTASDPSQVENFKENAVATLTALNTTEDTPEEQGPAPVISHRRTASSNEKRKSKDRSLPPFMDTEDQSGYISDLERALDDFKRSSEDYVKRHSRRGGQESVPVANGRVEHTVEEDTPMETVEDVESVEQDDCGETERVDPVEEDPCGETGRIVEPVHSDREQSEKGELEENGSSGASKSQSGNNADDETVRVVRRRKPRKEKHNEQSK